jgi:hypothetical protein
MDERLRDIKRGGNESSTLATLAKTLDYAVVFTLSHEPYWMTQEASASLLPDPGRWLESLLSDNLRARRTRDRMLRQINELVIRNAENLRWAVIRGIDETFRMATAELQSQLDEAISATRSVIDKSLSRRRDASHAIEVDLDRFARTADLLSMLRQQIDGSALQKNNALTGRQGPIVCSGVDGDGVSRQSPQG